MSVLYNPNGIFEQNSAKGGVCPLLDAAELAHAAGTLTWIAAVTGKRIRVVSGCYSSAVAGTILFTSNALNKWADNTVVAGVSNGTVLPFNPAGWFESETGQSLVVVTTQIYNLSTRYFYYTP